MQCHVELEREVDLVLTPQPVSYTFEIPPVRLFRKYLNVPESPRVTNEDFDELLELYD